MQRRPGQAPLAPWLSRRSDVTADAGNLHVLELNTDPAESGSFQVQLVSRYDGTGNEDGELPLPGWRRLDNCP